MTANIAHLPPLGAHQREEVGHQLQATLVELVDLSLLGTQLYWTVAGPLFRSLHLTRFSFWRGERERSGEHERPALASSGTHDPPSRLMEVAAAEYEYDGHLIRVDGAVLEQFSRGVLGSERIPLAWVAVDLEPRRHDQLRVEIGMASSPEAPFYSSPAFREARFNFEIPAAEEAKLRAFLDAAAGSAGRAT